MKDLMALIDDRHVQYADYAVSRVQYKVGVDSDLSGQLVRICRELGQLDGAATEQAPRAINELFDLFSITFVGVESLRTPVRLRDTYEAPPIEALDEDPDAIRILREQLARDMQRHITPHKVRTYIAQFLAENDPVETAQLPLENVQDYLMLLGLHIYATMSDSPYKCLPAPDDRPWIDTGAYYCANLRFASTEDKNAANA